MGAAQGEEGRLHVGRRSTLPLGHTQPFLGSSGFGHGAQQSFRPARVSPGPRAFPRTRPDQLLSPGSLRPATEFSIRKPGSWASSLSPPPACRPEAGVPVGSSSVLSCCRHLSSSQTIQGCFNKGDLLTGFSPLKVIFPLPSWSPGAAASSQPMSEESLSCHLRDKP